ITSATAAAPCSPRSEFRPSRFTSMATRSWSNSTEPGLVLEEDGALGTAHHRVLDAIAPLLGHLFQPVADVRVLAVEDEHLGADLGARLVALASCRVDPYPHRFPSTPLSARRSRASARRRPHRRPAVITSRRRATRSRRSAV